MFIKLNSCLRNKKGVSSVEYVLLIALIVLGLVAVFGTFKDQIVDLFDRAGEQLEAIEVEPK